MSALLTAVGSVVTSCIDWLSSFAGLFTETVTTGSGESAVTVLANPILLVPICLTVAGFGVGILKRLMSVQ